MADQETREHAHRDYPVGPMVTVEEGTDSDFGIRYQAVCWARHEDWACDWCSPWQHAVDHVESELEQDIANGTLRGDPAQRAYEVAEALGRDHLVEWGALTDQEGTGSTSGGTDGTAAELPADRPAEGVAPRG